MPPNFATIASLTEGLNQNASEMVLAIRAFRLSKAPGGDDLTASQKQTLQTKYLTALTESERTAVAIRAELAS